MFTSKNNLGYSKAVNLGVEKSSGKFICLLNPDTLVKQDTFEVLSRHLKENENADIIGCKVLNSDGTFQIASRRKFPSFWVSFCKAIGLNTLFPKSKYFGQYNYSYRSKNKIQNVDAVNGACLMFKRDIFDRLNGFDEAFFLYFEDTDFCYRAKKLGLNVVYTPQTSIIHYKGESHVKATFNVHKIFLESMTIFYMKHKKEFIFWNFISLLLPVAKIIKRLLFKLSLMKDKILALVTDIVFISSSFSAVLLVWFNVKYQKEPSFSLIYNHLLLLVAIIFSWLVASKITKLYSKNLLSYPRSAVSSGVMFLISATLTYLMSFFAYSRIVLIFSTILILLFTALWRIIIHFFALENKSLIFNKSLFKRNAVIIGSSVEAIRIGNALKHSPHNDFNLVGNVADKILESSDINKLGRLDDLKGVIENLKINEIIIPENEMYFEDMIHLLENISNLNVNLKIVPNGTDMFIGKGVIENISGIPLIDLDLPMLDTFHLHAKRMFDIMFAILLLIPTLPVYFIYFMMNRVSTFQVWTTNDSKMTLTYLNSKSKMFKRIPYLIHILKGDLSFVGSQIFKSSFPNPKVLIKPGLTGLAQIKESEINQEESTIFDHYYIQNQSFMYDIEIIFKSILRV
jgi:hypothetical protein